MLARQLLAFSRDETASSAVQVREADSDVQEPHVCSKAGV